MELGLPMEPMYPPWIMEHMYYPMEPMYIPHGWWHLVLSPTTWNAYVLPMELSPWNGTYVWGNHDTLPIPWELTWWTPGSPLNLWINTSDWMLRERSA